MEPSFGEEQPLESEAIEGVQGHRKIRRILALIRFGRVFFFLEQPLVILGVILHRALWCSFVFCRPGDQRHRKSWLLDVRNFGCGGRFGIISDINGFTGSLPNLSALSKQDGRILFPRKRCIRIQPKAERDFMLKF